MNCAPVVTLRNGTRVANFSSPHPFTFNDGTVLPACSRERSEALMLHQMEVVRQSPLAPAIQDVLLDIAMTPIVASELDRLDAEYCIDVVLVPYMVLDAIKRTGRHLGKARVCRTMDRQTKTISCNKFCV